MRLWIRKSDIRNGKRKRVRYCPIALAAQRKYPGVDAAMGIYTLDVGSKSFVASPEAQDFVLRFDRGEIPNPGYLTFKEMK